MKRYLIFAALGPLLGGFLLLFATTYMSGYWTETNLAEVKKLFVVFAKTLQYSYMFGIVPSLMLAAVDDILWHVKRIGAVARMLIVGFDQRDVWPEYRGRGTDRIYADLYEHWLEEAS